MSAWLCPVCQEQNRKPSTSGESFIWSRCSNCGLNRLSPRPSMEGLRELYSQEYEPHWPPLAQESNWLRRQLRQRHHSLRIRLVNRAMPQGGRVLDVGCGSGGFLCSLGQDARWYGEGVDFSESALAVARAQQLSVCCGQAQDLPFTPASFEIITLWEVLEHLPYPREALLVIRRLLTPGGKLLLSTPNAESWLANMAGPYWPGRTMPYHLYLFSWENLCHLLKMTGFAVEGRRFLPMERYFLQKTIQTWQESHDRHRFNLLWRAVSMFLPLAAWPLLRGIDHAPGASAIILEATAK